MNRPPASFAIAGGGIIGLATALRLQQRFPDAAVTLLEREAAVAQHQSTHNSGVLHAGLYYKPGSLKAKLATTGIRRMVEFCQQHDIRHEICGKCVIATAEEEITRLRDLHQRGEQNGLKDLRWLSPEALREIEPNAAGLAALHVPEEGIVDYKAVCAKMRELIERAGGKVLTNAAVQAMRRDGNTWLLQTAAGEQRADFVFNCAGLQCDRVLASAGETRSSRIVPFRGEYYLMTGESSGLVRHLIYPVPDPRFPFLGVHFTRMAHGGVECGPNAVLALKREGYRWSDFSFRDTFDALSFPGLWRFLAKYPSLSFYEVKRSLSKTEFTRSLQRLVPAVQESHLVPGVAGVRAQALGVDGTLLQDFELVERPGALHLINAPSPGATASLAIADYIIDRVPGGN
jgi:(S)-2-hydroxyglutarate dehydrogenase